MDAKKILAFSVYYFIALNLSTLIVVQFSLDIQYSWMVYAGTIFIATLPCVYLVQRTTVLYILVGIGAGLAGIFALPVWLFGGAAAATGGAGLITPGIAAGLFSGGSGIAGAGMVSATSIISGLFASSRPVKTVIKDLLPGGEDSDIGDDFMNSDDPPPLPIQLTMTRGGRRRRNRRGGYRAGFFAIPLY